MRVFYLLLCASAVSLTGCVESSSPEPLSSESAAPASESSASAPDAGPRASTHPDLSNRPSEGAAAAEPGPSAATEPLGKDDAGRLVLDRLEFAVPEGWKRNPAASSFVMAEFSLPRADKDTADGRLTISSAGGSVEANIERWRGQFGGKPAESSEKRIQVDGMDVTIVELSGEFSDQRGPFAPGGAKQSGYRMFGAILPLEGESYFVKAVGPHATIGAHADRLRAFVESARKK